MGALIYYTMHSTINRTVVFVDGQNFKKNLQTFAFGDGGGYRLDEKHFKWQRFFSDLVSKFDRENTTHSLLRVYWYNADDVTSWYEYPRDIRMAASECMARTPGITVTEEQVKELARQWWERERESVRKAREDVFPDIQQRVEFLEFCYTGIYKLAPFIVHSFGVQPSGEYRYQGTRIGEKGVDLGIAVDMVGKMSGYDAAILVSGDADFMPVVRHLKDNLKSVYQFSIAKGVPPNIKYLSADLKVHVDAFRHCNELELLANYLDRDFVMCRIPDPVLAAIDTRIQQLRALQATK